MPTLPLSRGLVALVDEEDLAWLSQWKWYAKAKAKGRGFYVVRNATVDGRRTTLPVHRAIMATARDMDTDHINGDGLDNRRANLRVCTTAENTKNMRPRVGRRFKGITWREARGCWVARIIVNYRHMYLGAFALAEDAARAYDAAALRLHGRFAQLNFPEARSS